MTGARDERLTADRAARRIAQREFDAPVILEAGAGTGKTTTLVARVLSWALTAGWAAARRELTRRPPDRAADAEPAPAPDRIAIAVLEGIVSITFTEAAAAEMESRIAEALSRVAAGRAGEIVGFDPPEIAGGPDAIPLEVRAHSLLAGLDHLTVRTIHAYCLSLLKRYPLEAGLHPELVVDADGRILEELVGEVVETGLRGAYTAAGEGPLIHLARNRIGPRKIAEALRLLAEQGVTSAQLAEDPFAPELVAAMLGRLRAPLERFEQLVGGRFDGLPANQNAPKVAAAARATRATLDRLASDASSGIEAAVELCATLAEGWTQNLVKAHLGKWKRGQLSKAELAALGDDAQLLGPIAAELRATLRQLQVLDPRLLDQARRALGSLLAQIEDEMRARGVITFNGLLSEARRLLAADAAVRRRERGRLRQLLVDEFQDTDRQQCDLVRLLALSGSPRQRPGLFVVGDPKQSIYGWRNADLEAYEGFVRSATAAGGERHSLVENFRSAAPILDEVDRAITPVMLQRAGLQPRYERLLACDALVGSAGFDRAGRAAIEYWVSWAPPGGSEPSEEDTRVDDAAPIEAEAVARDILEIHRETGAGWNDFAVLLRSGNRLDTFLAAFRDAGVPFAVTRDKSYFRRREIIEAAALIRAIVNPVDHLALLTFLRSPVAGVPDAAIIPLWRLEFPDLMSEHDRPSKPLLAKIRRIVRTVSAELPSSIPGIEAIKGWDKSLIAATEALLRLRESFARDPADVFIENVRTWLLLEVAESARYLGSFRVANLERFLRHLESALDRSGGDVHPVLRALRRSVAEAREAEEAVPKEAALDAVQILTIHAAKGLEFKHIYLAQLHAGPGGGDKEVDVDERWAPGERFEYRLFGAPTPNFDRVAERRRQVENAERVRLLYVAMTRARERLVLIGKWPARPAPVHESRRESFVDLLQSRAPLPESVRALAPDGADGGRGAASCAALWCFPAYGRPAPSGRRRFELPAWLPGPASVRASAERLRELGAEAAARMERPFHLAATHEAGQRLESLARESGLRRAAGRGVREAALEVGTAIHRLFETWRLEAEPETELRRQRGRVEAYLRAALGEELHAEALGRAGELLERIEAGTLLDRFLGLRERIVARELPVALPPSADGDGPVGFLSGAIDLVYRDDGGALVVVDYKTDVLELELEIDARAADYVQQERVYARALRSALDLSEPPACELWFLWPDRLHRVEPAR